MAGWAVAGLGFFDFVQVVVAQKHVFWIGNEGDTAVLSSAKYAVIICPLLLVIIGTVVPMIIGTLQPMDLAPQSSQNKPKNMFFG